MKRTAKRRSRPAPWVVFGLAAAILWPAHRSVAAEFSVSPMRMDLAYQESTAAVTVANQDARPLRIGLRLAEWSQDESGQDVYREVSATGAMAGQVTIGPGESSLLNVGFSPPAGRNERAYRLFLNELPQAGATGNFLISFALPIFFVPADPEPRAEIEQAALVGGELRVTLANPGNQHVRIESLGATTGAGFTKEIGGWYLLAGARRVHTLTIPASVCRGLRRLDIRIRTEKLELNKSIDVAPAMCAR